MKRQDIAFDLDGTLIDLMPPVRRVLKEKFGAVIKDNGNWKIETEPFLTQKQIWQAFDAAYCCLNEIKAYTGARELLQILWDMTGEPIKIVTARPIRAATMTHLLVNSFCKVPFEISFAANGDKLPYLRGRQYFVEDHGGKAAELALANKNVFLIDAPYNQSVELVPGLARISSIEDLIPLAAMLVKEGRD